MTQLTFDSATYREREEDPSEDSDERYTSPETMAWCRGKAMVAVWDVDVAACAESHWAERFYTKEDSGLRRPWFGNVWCNPPWSGIEPWVGKAWEELDREDGPDIIAMLLPGNRTEQPWWQDLVEPFRDRPPFNLRTHFVPGRARYGCPGNPKGIGMGSPNFTSVLLVWRRS